ncbi:Exopolyphosphatase [Acarospora aff. strigata]|nr:Exopolyphosphatase [Acarospora aff. strigata]
MAFPRNSLRAFLSHAKIVLRSTIEQSQKITLVIGNESADLDSLTSCIVYAYVRSCSPPRDAFTPLYIPIANIPAADIRLRPEFLEVCRHVNIEAKHLITLDDLPAFESLKDKLKPEKTKWILVDHNKLQGTLGEIYASKVGGVIDHHDEEHAVPLETGNEPRVIEKCGSCTTLVVRYCRDSWDQLSSQSLSSGAAHAQGDSLVDDSAVSRVWDAQLAKLALASILIDTTNLTMKAKVEPADVEAAEYLEAKINLSPKDAVTYDRQKYYAEIDRAKRDIDSLQLIDVLRKDYKEWNEGGKKLGISSVVKPIEWLSQKAGPETSLSHSVQSFAEERSLSLYGIMTAFRNNQGEFERELILWALDSSVISATERFVQNAREELELEERAPTVVQEGRDSVWRKVWLQRNVGKSRKQLAPLLRNAMHD